jgi:hypothetical protein
MARPSFTFLSVGEHLHVMFLFLFDGFLPIIMFITFQPSAAIPSGIQPSPAIFDGLAFSVLTSTLWQGATALWSLYLLKTCRSDFDTILENICVSVCAGTRVCVSMTQASMTQKSEDPHPEVWDSKLFYFSKSVFLQLSLLQMILEKFEFFPIKCRVQRSLEIFNAKQKDETKHSHSKDFKLKVCVCSFPKVIS